MTKEITPAQIRNAMEAGRRARAEAFANGLAALFGRGDATGVR